jgi:formate dehydrogenase assembly factor FdhD
MRQAGDRIALMVEDGSEGGRGWHAAVFDGFDAGAVRVPLAPRDVERLTNEQTDPPARWTVARGRFLAIVAHQFARCREAGVPGGIHHASAGDGDGVCVVASDVSRHNAVDKVVGWAVKEDLLPLTVTVLMVSGRASFELTQKALMAGIPILAAVSAPSSLAAELAAESGMTLVGFLRGASMVAYAGAERIVGLPAHS